MKIVVNEIFRSIQGESLYTGLPCVFIRLTGCNLRCSYCDTEYAYDEGYEMSISDILHRIHLFGCPLVELTGGEPLLQKHTPSLVNELIKNHFKVLVETNGSKDINILHEQCIKIMDIKCPSSGESAMNDLNNIRRLKGSDQLKFVIRDTSDFLFAVDLINTEKPLIPHGQILMSPVSGHLAPAELAEWILNSDLNVRLHLQMHKIIWPDIDRGV